MGIFSVILGAILMALGGTTLAVWLAGKTPWLGGGLSDRPATKLDATFLYLYFIAMVLAPLLTGGILIVVGLVALN